jgi:acetyl esterase/lipase
MNIKAIAVTLALAAGCGTALAQQASAPPVIQLWPNGAPGSEKHHGEAEKREDNLYPINIHDPSLTVMRADARHANGTAVVVVPGGGHRINVFQSEGVQAAQHLNRLGITAFILKYRLARDPNSKSDAGTPYTIEGDATNDTRRAIRWVRAHAAEYGIDTHRVGLMGFSAGGELVSMVADNPEPAASASSSAKRDAIDGQNARPDFQVLVYPGPLGVPAKSVQNAPPAFLVAGAKDKCCMPPTIGLFQQLQAAGIPAELHIYADTDHAFNMGRGERLSIAHWPDRLSDWLADGGWLVPHGGRAPEGVPAP